MSFEASGAATGTARSIRGDHHVANVARHAARAPQQPAIRYDATADAGAHRHIDHV